MNILQYYTTRFIRQKLQYILNIIVIFDLVPFSTRIAQFNYSYLPTRKILKAYEKLKKNYKKKKSVFANKELKQAATKLRSNLR